MTPPARAPNRCPDPQDATCRALFQRARASPSRAERRPAQGRDDERGAVRPHHVPRTANRKFSPLHLNLRRGSLVGRALKIESSFRAARPVARQYISSGWGGAPVGHRCYERESFGEEDHRAGQHRFWSSRDFSCLDGAGCVSASERHRLASRHLLDLALSSIMT